MDDFYQIAAYVIFCPYAAWLATLFKVAGARHLNIFAFSSKLLKVSIATTIAVLLAIVIRSFIITANL